MEDVVKGTVAAFGDVGFDSLGLHLAAVLEHDRFLPCEKGLVGITASSLGLPPVERPHDRGGLSGGDLLVERALRFDPNQRPLTTEPETADLADLDSRILTSLDDCSVEFLLHGRRPGEQAASGRADLDAHRLAPGSLLAGDLLEVTQSVHARPILQGGLGSIASSGCRTPRRRGPRSERVHTLRYSERR